MNDPIEGDPSAVLGSALTPPLVYIPAAGDAGNAILQFTATTSGGSAHVLSGGTEASPAQGEQIALHGVPVTGFMVYNVTNANASRGVLANYGGTFPHRTTVHCVGQNTFGCDPN